LKISQDGNRATVYTRVAVVHGRVWRTVCSVCATGARVAPVVSPDFHWTCAGGAGGVDDGDDGVPSLVVVVAATPPPVLAVMVVGVVSSCGDVLVLICGLQVFHVKTKRPNQCNPFFAHFSQI
jgi:hypothetical protein